MPYDRSDDQEGMWYVVVVSRGQQVGVPGTLTTNALCAPTGTACIEVTLQSEANVMSEKQELHGHTERGQNCSRFRLQESTERR